MSVRDDLKKIFRLNNAYNEISCTKVFIREIIEDDLVPIIKIEKSLKEMVEDSNFVNMIIKNIVEYEKILIRALNSEDCKKLIEEII